MSASSRTSARSAARPVRRLGSETPRIFTPPLRPLTPETSAGYSIIAFAVMLGVDLFPWQKWFLIHAFELLPSGRFRFRKVVLLVARQNGKSTLSWLIALWFMYVRGVGMVLGTAQELDVAEEIWSMAVAAATDDEENPELAAEVVKLIETNGKKELRLANGSRYKVKAASRRAGRGFTGDLIMLDELREHQNWAAWSAITKTTMTRPDAFVLGLSNAGDVTSVVLRHLRRIAHLALGDPDGDYSEPDTGTVVEEPPDDTDDDESTVGLFEWSSTPGCDVWDRDEWGQGNPSMNHPGGVDEGALAGFARTDPEMEFRTECLCQWSTGATDGPFPSGRWLAGIDTTSTINDQVAVSYCVDVSADRTLTHIAVAGKRADELPHVAVVASRPGTDWPLEWFRSRASVERPMTVVVQAKGAPASSLIDDLAALEHVTVVEWGGPDLGNATAKLYDLVNRSGLVEEDGQPPRREGLCHRPQPVLDVAAAVAVPKILTDGGMAWDRRKSPQDIAPLVAVTGALWHSLQRDEPAVRSAYEDRGLLTIDL